MQKLYSLGGLGKAPLLGRFSLLECGSRFLSLFFVFSSWLMPIHFLPWVSWHSEVMVFFAVFLMAWASLVFKFRGKGLHTIGLPFAALAVVGLAGVLTFQNVGTYIFFSGDIWLIELYAGMCIVCLTLGYEATLTPTQVFGRTYVSSFFAPFALIIVIGGVLSTIIAFAQIFSLWEHSGWIVRMPDMRRPGGNLAQPNQLATLLVMAVASLIFLRHSKKLGPVASGMLLFLLCLGIAITESRTGALSLLLLLSWWLLKRKKIGDSTPAWAGIGCGIGFVGLFWAWPKILNLMLLTDLATVNTTSSLRLEVWSQLLHAVMLKPWWGWGFHQVAQAHNAVADGYTVSAPFSYSHNLLLDLMLWFGIPLTALLVLVTTVWLWRRICAANQLLPWYGLAVALPLAVHSMLEYPFAYAYFLAPVMFALGAVEGSLGIKPVMRLGIKPAAVVLLLTTITLAWSVVEYLEIEEDFRVARFEALHIGAPPPEHQAPTIILFDQLGVLLDDARITPTPNMSLQAMQTVRNAALYYPWSATQYRYALALALNGNSIEAARQFRVMRLFWGEKFYTGIKMQVNELAITKYPELRQLNLP
jgi:O-antigen ligase